MVVLAATNSATPSLPRTLILSRLEAARREADQAQAKLQSLRAQADAAETESQRRQEKVRTLIHKASRPDPTYDAGTKTGGAAMAVKAQQLLSGLSDTGSLEGRNIANGSRNMAGTTPVFDTQGLAAGRIVNLSV